MRLLHTAFAGVALLLATLPLSASTHHAPSKSRATGRSHSSSRSHAASHSRAHGRSTSAHGSRTRGSSRTVAHTSAAPAIPGERATQIQSALIQGGYLSGEPSGSWDTSTVAAMKKYQSDNGWQSKYTPDARALKKLGLGAQDASPAVPQPPL